jgi:superfamily I DNA/RNA helicase
MLRGRYLRAIYSWRGAEVSNIRTKFDGDFAGAETVMLNKNYRSTATIVKAAAAVIGVSTSRSALELDAVTPGGKDVAVVATECEVEEANYAAREAAKIARGGVPLKEIAVLYRTHSQSRPLEEAFIRAGVPHVVVGDTVGKGPVLGIPAQCSAGAHLDCGRSAQCTGWLQSMGSPNYPVTGPTNHNITS